VGLFLWSGTLPTDSATLLRLLPLMAGALLLLWLGGILMGFAAGRRPPRPR
jgi:hypothetical protein